VSGWRVGWRRVLERRLAVGWGALDDGRRFVELLLPGRALWATWGGRRCAAA
jgi:hypothetical protein